jgi:hypothetical protein
VTEPAELTHDVLLRVAEFLRKLPADQLADLARGDARLEVVPKGGRTRMTTTTGGALPRPAEEINSTMRGMGDRLAARRYLATDLKLTVPLLKALAKEFDLPATGTKDKLLDTIVEWAVGRRQDSDAIARAVTGR